MLGAYTELVKLFSIRISSTQNGNLIAEKLVAQVQQLKPELNGSRHVPSHQKVMVVLSDGTNSAGSDPISEAAAAKASGIRIFSVGLGAGANSKTLEEVASAPVDYFFAPTTAELSNIYQAIAGEVQCK